VSELGGGAVAMATTALGFAAAVVRARETEQERGREASEGRDARWPL